MGDGELMAHEAQRVAERSKRPRAEVCWLGRQDMRAVIVFGGGLCSSSSSSLIVDGMVGFGEDVIAVVDGEGVRVKSTSSHQSNSVMFVTPESRNHFLLPNGAKKWQLG